MPHFADKQNLHTQHPKEADQQLRTRTYRAPRLHVYGTMTRLTAGGSGSATEGSSGANKRP